MKNDVTDLTLGRVADPVLEHFNLSVRSVIDLRVILVEKRNCKSKLKREKAETGYISKFKGISEGLYRDLGYLALQIY